ncbi:phosphate ABC transporter substrate-binding protein PstS [Candidatus Solirubrobacter pratensis]|uniref:phosphate ABC transporter substrate-binding protein PstS n=1 Tax=Candidatus Solirubrobacter pratensis TaxID=1298857 RepID=UPI00040DB350|nr:phosphate ABC transporter substrate-binding protein PstS [Candidatus Solirubrobacter pratensis]
MKRSRFVALALGTLTVGVAGSASNAMAQDAQLVGAGSTLVAPLMAKWSLDFQGKNNIKVTYGAVGSGAGIAQITARTVDFGASDAPLSAAQAAACHGCVQIPWALTATGIAFHIDGVKKLQLNSSVLSQIFQGQISMWNDRRIKAINKGVSLPALKITPVFRSDGSGDTYAFTDFLSRTSPSWKGKVGFGTQVSFPTGVGGKGNDGVTAVVSSTNGAISYISAAYIIAHGLKAAALQNAAGKFEYPNLKNIQAAADVVKRVPASNEMHIVAPPKSAKTAYPLSTFTYAIVPKATPKASGLSKLVLYAMTDGQKYGPALDFARIPPVVLKAAKNTLKQVKQG